MNAGWHAPGLQSESSGRGDSFCRHGDGSSIDGPARTASVHYPNGIVAVHKGDALYVLDSAVGAVRRIDVR